MRLSFLLSHSFLLFSVSLMAQSQRSMADSLRRCGLIEKKYEKTIEETLQGTVAPPRSSVLYALYNVEMRKMTGRKKIKGMMYISFGEEELPPAEWSTIRANLRVRLKKLQTCSFVSPSVATLANAKIDSNQFRHPLQLISMLMEEEKKKEWLSPQLVLPFIEKLYQYKILSDTKHKQLEEDLKKKELETHYELIPYCEQARLFDLAKYSNDPATYLEKIHREVAALLPELAFTDFSWKIVLDSVNSSLDFQTYDALVSFTCQGKKYEQASFISLDELGKKDSYFGKIGTQEFYQIFNKVLADHQSSKRLHLIQSQAYDDSRYFGIIALNKEQEEALQNGSYFPTSYENFQNSLTTKQIEEAIAAYRSIGLFYHLNEAQIQQATRQVRQNNPRNLNQVLLFFPSVVYYFDSEMQDLDAPYKSILLNFSTISHGLFFPEDIVDEFNAPTKEGCLASFFFGGKQYSKRLRVESDWVDSRIFNLIDDAVKEQKLPGRFYFLVTEGQEQAYVFLSPAQFEELKAKKLLVFEEDMGEKK